MLAYSYSEGTQHRTYILQGDLFCSAGLHRNHVLATANTGKIGQVWEKMWVKWTRRVEISKEEIPDSKEGNMGFCVQRNH